MKHQPYLDNKKFSFFSEYQRTVITTLARIELVLKDLGNRVSLLESPKNQQEETTLLDQPFSSFEELKEFDSTLVEKAKRKKLV